MNFATSETDLAAVAARTGGTWALFPHTSPVASAHLRLLDAEEHAKLCFSVFREHKVPGLAFINCPQGLSPSDARLAEFADCIMELAGTA